MRTSNSGAWREAGSGPVVVEEGEARDVKDMFGNETGDRGDGSRLGLSKTLLSRRLPNYRKAGTESCQRCKNCAHLETFSMSRTYYKCALVGGGSANTDIRLGNVCDAWAAAEPPAKGEGRS